MDPAVTAAIITGAAAVIGPIVTYYATKHRGRGAQFTAEALPNREAVYELASKLIRGGRRILDTTWGSDCPKLLDAERLAKDRYLEAQRQAISRDNTTYLELFTLTNDERRGKRFAAAVDAASTHKNYQARLLHGVGPSFPMIDFLVVDDRHIILSFLASHGIRQGHQYIYVRSDLMAKYFTEYFDECWRVGEPVTKPEKSTNPPVPTNAS